MQVRVRVTKLTNVDGRDYRGGTYFVEQAIADSLVKSGNASVVESSAQPNEINTPPAPPFPATAISHNKQASASATKKPATKKPATKPKEKK